MLKNGILAKANAVLAQSCARVLIQLFDILGDFAARDHPQRFDELKANAPRQPFKRFVILDRQQRLEKRGDFALHPMPKAAAHLFSHLRTGFIVNKNLDLRGKRIRPRHQLANRRIAPHQAALLGEIKFRIRRVIHFIRAQIIHRLQARQRRGAQCFGLLVTGLRVQNKSKSIQLADKLVFNGHIAVFTYLGQEPLLLLQPPHQNTGAAINESLGQARM